VFEISLDRLGGALGSLAEDGIPPSAEAIMAVRALVDRLEALVAAAEVSFDGGEGWRERGAGSMRSWLADEGGLSRRAAALVARRTDRLRRWPALLTAWQSGRVTGAVVDAMCDEVPVRFADGFATDVDGVLDIVAPPVDDRRWSDTDPALDAREVGLVVRHWVRRAEADDGPESFSERPSGAYLSSTWGGRVRLDAELCPADGAVLAAALRVFDVPDAVDAGDAVDETASTGRVIGRERIAAEKRADALVAMARFALDHHRRPGSVRSRPHVSLIVQLSELQAAAMACGSVTVAEELDRLVARRSLRPGERALCTAARRNGRVGEPGAPGASGASGGSGGSGESIGSGGWDVPSGSVGARALDGAVGAPTVELGPVAASLLTCDSVVHRVLMAGSRVIELGRDERTTPVWLRTAVVARDHHCRAPGCDRSARHCDVHHIDHWALGGRTDLHRLVLLCTFHHHQFHRPGHRMSMDEHARFTVEFPDGRRRTTSPPCAGALTFGGIGPDG